MGLDKFYQSLGSENKSLKKMEEEIKEWKETPKYKVGMFFKLLNNKDIFRKPISSSRFEKDINSKEFNDATEFILYNRVWFWIKDFNSEDSGWVESVLSYKEDGILKGVNKTLQYFESIEEFEKCALLFSIQKILKNA
jgi:hypothetical protein